MAMGVNVPDNLKPGILYKIKQALLFEGLIAGGIDNHGLPGLVIQYVCIDPECVESKAFYLYHSYQIRCKYRK
jgi:hypothetical protein